MWYKFTGSPKDVFFGHTEKTSNRHPDRTLDFWVFGFLYSGQMGLHTGKEEASLKAGSFYLLPPGIRHFGTDANFSDIYWVHFKAKAATSILPEHVDFKNIILPLFGTIPPESAFKPVMEAMSRLSLKGLSSDEMKGVQLKSLMYSLSLHSQKSALEQTPRMKAVYELFDFLEKNINSNISSDFMEKMTGYCYYELNNLFKKHFGTTIKQKVIEIKMNRAFEMLARGEKIARVADSLGFKDYYYFLKLFKKTKYLTPKQLKNRYIEVH